MGELIGYIIYRLVGACLVVPFVNYWWPSIPPALAKQSFRKLPRLFQFTYGIAHYTPLIYYWWTKQKWFPSMVSEGMFIDYDLKWLKKRIDTPNNNQVILAVFSFGFKRSRCSCMNLIRNYDSPTFSISSCGFPFGFPKRPHTNGDVLFTYKSMINSLISRCGTPLPMILNNPPLEQSTP